MVLDGPGVADDVDQVPGRSAFQRLENVQHADVSPSGRRPLHQGRQPSAEQEEVPYPSEAMAQDEEDGDDLAVNLSWPGGPTVAGRRPAPEPGSGQPASAAPPSRPPAPPRAAPPDNRRPVPDDLAVPPGPGPTGSRSMMESAPSAPPVQPPATRYGGATDARRTQDGRPSSELPSLPGRRPGTPGSGRAAGTNANETLLSILDHLTTLSQLVTGTSRATSAELAALGAQVDKAVADINALQLRVVRSLEGFDALRLRVQKGLADRPPLSDDDVARIAERVTERLLDHVRVQTEEDL